jgi:hypothetical protein
VNRQETVALTRIVAATCPQQAIDDYTPDAWYELLDDLSLDDCRNAVRVIGRRQPFIAPAEIRAEVKRIREDRIARAFIPAPAPELADDPAAYREALAGSIRAAADGELPPASDQPMAIAPPPGQRNGGPPVSLRGAITDLRRQLPPPAPGRAVRSPQEIAAEQAAGSRQKAGERNEPEPGEVA